MPDSLWTYEIDEHTLSLEELSDKFQTNLDVEDFFSSAGLSSLEAKRRLERDGPNVVEPRKRVPEVVRWLLKFTDPLILLMLMAAALFWLGYALDASVPANLYCAVLLCVSIAVQCTATYVEERIVARAMDAMARRLPMQCIVIREGEARRIPCAELVEGDLIQLTAGDRVPADARMVYDDGLKVQDAWLTGEYEAFPRTVEPTRELFLESRNLAFCSSHCTEGSGIAVVYRTGGRTLLARLDWHGGLRRRWAALQQEAHRATKLVLALACAWAAAAFATGAARGLPWAVILNLSVTAFVAAVPQGIPTAVAACLRGAAQRLSREQVVVKNLYALEALGRASFVCLDKTGVLTLGCLRVESFWHAGRFGPPSGSGAVPAAAVEGGGLEPGHDLWRGSPWGPALVAACVCNKARFTGEAEEKQLPEVAVLPDSSAGNPPALACVRDPLATSGGGKGAPVYPADGEQGAGVPTMRQVVGLTSDSVLLRYCDSICPVDRVRELFRVVYNYPHSWAGRDSMCVVVPPGNLATGKYFVLVKGPAERVMRRCDRWLCGGAERPMDQDYTSRFQEAYARFAEGGARILCFAWATMDAVPQEDLAAAPPPDGGFTFAGLAALGDPTKAGAREAVWQLRSAGIRTLMMTGDHHVTAEAVAREVNIITKPTRRDVGEHRNVAAEDTQVNLDDRDICAMVLSSQDFEHFPEDVWIRLLDHEEIVLAKSAPSQKLNVVERLQSRGEVVAMVGDGLNDIPAMKGAHVSIAVGSPNVPDMVRSEADIVVLDGDVGAVVSAIREGRALSSNLKKSVAYALSHVLPAMVPIFLRLALALPPGQAPALVLALAMLGELPPTVALAGEEPEPAAMQAPPDSAGHLLVSVPVLLHSYALAGAMEAAVSVLAFFCALRSCGIGPADLSPSGRPCFAAGAPCRTADGQALTAEQQAHVLALADAAAYGNMLLCQAFHVWFCRTRIGSVADRPWLGNRSVLWAVLWQLAFLCAPAIIPEVWDASGSGRVPVQLWLLSLCFLCWVALHSETVKWCARRELRTGRRSALRRLSW